METTRKQYTRPELLELGPADELTLGQKGCRTDYNDCEEEDATIELA